MPNVKTSHSSCLRDLVKEFAEDIFTCDNSVLFCKICNVKVVADKTYNIQQHITREKHVKGLKLRKETETTKSQVY